MQNQHGDLFTSQFSLNGSVGCWEYSVNLDHEQCDIHIEICLLSIDLQAVGNTV